MQNYEKILEDLGIEIPEDKKADLKKKMSENYKTVADYNKQVEKKDEYKTSSVSYTHLTLPTTSRV